MAKYSFLNQCDKCKSQFKNKKALANHKRKCDKNQLQSNLFICKFCRKWFRKSRIKEHEIYCEYYIFFHKYDKLFNFVFRLIRSYNKQNIKNKYARFINEKRYIIFNEKIKNKTKEEIIKEEDESRKKDYVKKNKKILDNYYSKEKEKIYNKMESFHINREDKKAEDIFDLMQTIEYKENINLSFRQILFDFYDNKIKEEKKVPNFKIHDKIIDKYFYKDFFMQHEIKYIDEELFKDVCYLQNTLDEYDKRYDYYYNILDECYKSNKNQYLCVFCNNYYYYKWQHYRKCKKLENEYNHSVYATFMKFVNNNFSKDTLNKVELNYIYKNYANKDLYYFINNIKENIENPYNFDENKHNFIYNINEVKIENIILEKCLNKLFIKIKKEYEIDVNLRQQRYLREISIKNYLQNGKFKINEIIKKFKEQYNLDINNEKIIKENENIINKLIIISNNENGMKNKDNEEESESDIDEEEINKEIEKNKILAPRSIIEEEEEEEEEINEEKNPKQAEILKKFINDAYNKMKEEKKEIKYIIKK